MLDKLLPVILPPCIAQVIGRGTPVDFNKKFIDGKPIFGKGKTWVGTLGGIGISFIVLEILYFLGLIFDNVPSDRAIGLFFFLSCGSMFGDLFNSFIKRRLGIERGGKFIGDRVNSPLGGFVFTYIMCPDLLFSVYSVIDMVVITSVVGVGHVLLSRIAHKVGIKKERW